MATERIRPIALGVFRNKKNDSILVFEGFDQLKQLTYYRPLGGGIDFGEYGHQTLVREMKEELLAEVTNLRYLATVENIFTSNGNRGHEIVQLYEGEFVDPSIYEQPELVGHEDDGSPFKAMWKPLIDFQNGALLFPNGLLKLLS